MSDSRLAAVDRVLAVGGDADDVLRGVVQALAAEPGIEWAGILFLEQGALALGPEAGVADVERRVAVPVSFQGVAVGELAVDGSAAADFLGEVAERISAYVLLGWDTGGEAWEP